MKRKPDPVKHCRQCGALMERKRYRGTLENYHIFSRRRVFCDHQCQGKWIISKAGNGVHKSTHHKRARRKALKDKCENCPETEKLQVHHVDGNYENDDDENLKTLCPNCHRLEDSRRRAAEIEEHPF